MDNKGFYPDLYDSTVEWWNISKDMMEWYRDLLGTEVIVTRKTESDKRKSVLSATLTSTFEDDDTTTHFNWKLLINNSNMTPVWKRNGNLEVVDTIRKLEIGDLVKFTYIGVQYEFKVTAMQGYGIGAEICYQYSLSPIVEHKI
jgi:hypothetical protein